MKPYLPMSPSYTSREKVFGAFDLFAATYFVHFYKPSAIANGEVEISLAPEARWGLALPMQGEIKGLK